jgi:hypothetical protein
MTIHSSSTLPWLVEWKPLGSTHAVTLTLGTKVQALRWAFQQRKSLATDVRILTRENGQWVPHPESMRQLLEKEQSLQADSRVTQALMQLGDLSSLLQKRSTKERLTPEQCQEFMELALKVMIAAGFPKSEAQAAIERAYNPLQPLPMNPPSQTAQKVNASIFK